MNSLELIFDTRWVRRRAKCLMRAFGASRAEAVVSASQDWVCLNGKCAHPRYASLFNSGATPS